MSELYHHGILGQHWGIRRYQNADGSLTEKGKKRLEKKDSKWVKKKYDKIMKKTKKKVSKDVEKIQKDINKDRSLFKSNGKLSASAINEYNKKVADLMTSAAKDIASPSGRSVKFVAKRGEIGVFMALADQGYNMDAVKNGVWGSGRIAYKQSSVERM